MKIGSKVLLYQYKICHRKQDLSLSNTINKLSNENMQTRVKLEEEIETWKKSY